MFKPCLRHVGDSRWWGSMTMILAGNKAKCLLSVNHTTKTIHHHHSSSSSGRIHRGRMYIQKYKNSILKSKSHFPTWTCQIIQIRMGDNINLFTLSESAINAIKKAELVQKIIALKGKVITHADISNLCSQISKLNNRIFQLHSTNEKIRSEVAVVKNVNTKLEEWIISLEKNRAKLEQYSWCNNTELSGILWHCHTITCLWTLLLLT